MAVSIIKKFIIPCFFIILSSLWGESWSPPVDLSDPAFSAVVTGVPPIGVDSNGNAIAVWVSQESSQAVVRASRYNATTQSWSSPEQIGSDSANDAHLAMTENGKAVAVWTNMTATPTTYANVFDGSVWLGEHLVDANASYQTQYYPRVSVDDFGRSYVMWQVQGGNLARVMRSSVYYFDTNSWSTAVNISTDYGVDNQFVGLPNLSVNSSGTANAIWIYQDTTTPLHKVQVNRYSGGSWLASGSEETIATSSSNTMQFAAPTVAVAPNGNAIALWAQYDATMSPIQQYTIWSSVFNLATLSWSAPLQISAAGIADISKIFTDVACDGGGNAIATWLLKDETTPPGTSVLQATTFPNLSWSTTVSTISDDTLLAYIGRVAVDNSGDAYATWTASDNSSFTNIQAAKYTKSSNSWGNAIAISDSGSFTTGPDQISGIAANGSGDFFAVWSHVDPSTSIVGVQASNVTLQPAPPSNVLGIVTAYTFLNSTEYVLESAWNPSSSTNILFYRLYNNGSLFAEVSALDPLLYVKIACQSDAFNNYAVAAVDSHNIESDRISMTIVHR